MGSQCSIKDTKTPRENKNPSKSLIIRLGRQVLPIGTSWQGDPVSLKEDNDSVSKVELQMEGGADS